MAKIIIAILIGTAAWSGLLIYYCLRGEERKNWKQSIQKIKQKKQFILTGIAAVGMIFSFCMAQHYHLVFVNSIRNELVFVWLLIIAVIDWKEQIIPKKLTTAGLLVWVIFVILAVVVGKASIVHVLLFSFGGLLLGGGLFVLCRLLSKGGVGMGDIRMFSVLGLLYGMEYTFSIVFFSVLLMSVYGIAGLIMKKKGIKDRVAMGPFVWASYCICIALGI